MRLTTMLRTLAREERGFTMVTVMTVMFCVTMLSIAALSAAQGDLKPGAHDKSRKVAHAAAEAGVQNYAFHLAENAEYWAKCTTGTPPHINNPWSGGLPQDDPRVWKSVPNSQARYTIELLPANGAAACSTADAGPTMIDAESATLKIRATGQNRVNGVKRSIIATFKRQSLLDFLYLTDKETRAPELYAMQIPSRNSSLDTDPTISLPAWAAANCATRYWGDDPALGNRRDQLFDGYYLDATGTQKPFTLGCVEAGFSSGEVLAGPVHTNDELKVACTPTPAPQFGDSIDDAVETSSLGQSTVSTDPQAGFRPCAPTVNFSTTTPALQAGTSRPRSAPLQLPLSNDALLSDTELGYRFKGKTKITMNGATMHVKSTRMTDGSAVDENMPIPADGVVYVGGDGSCPAYTPVDSDGAPATCANLELKGHYATNVTFTAENDIVVVDDVTRTDADSTFLLGLIATNYVRVHHPVINCVPADTCNSFPANGCEDAGDTPRDVSIDGAILSLTRSFVVDNWFCGGDLGTLRVHGAIAQKFRGPVNSVTRSNVRVGYYGKEYEYDTRLRYRSPPHFLDPVSAQWRLQTFSEQVPAR